MEVRECVRAVSVKEEQRLSLTSVVGESVAKKAKPAPTPKYMKLS